MYCELPHTRYVRDQARKSGLGFLTTIAIIGAVTAAAMGVLTYSTAFGLLQRV